MISRHDVLNHDSLPTTCHICARHVRWRAMTIQCTFPYTVYAVLICIDLNFIKVVSFPSVLIRQQGVIGMIRPDISHHSYVGIPVLSGTGHLLLIAFAVSSFRCQLLHVHLLSIIQMISSLVSSSYPSSLCSVSYPLSHIWITILVVDLFLAHTCSVVCLTMGFSPFPGST